MSQSLVAPYETILVVSDDVRDLAVASLILKNAGLNVLMASSPDEAIQISLTFIGSIRLLLTAVMMRGMAGPDLANQLMEQRPTLRTMMMTGYADGRLLLLNYGWHMIPRRFVRTVLAEKVRAVLNSPDRSQGTDHFDASL